MNKKEMRPMTVEDLKLIITNPFYCIKIDPMLCMDHEPIIDEKTWLTCAKNMIEEDGIDEFLKYLLINLKGGFVQSENGDSADGYILK